MSVQFIDENPIFHYHIFLLPWDFMKEKETKETKGKL